LATTPDLPLPAQTTTTTATTTGAAGPIVSRRVWRASLAAARSGLCLDL